MSDALESEHFRYLPLTLMMSEHRHAVEVLFETSFDGNVLSDGQVAFDTHGPLQPGVIRPIAIAHDL